jgi:hypothetical protein
MGQLVDEIIAVLALGDTRHPEGLAAARRLEDV